MHSLIFYSKSWKLMFKNPFFSIYAWSCKKITNPHRIPFSIHLPHQILMLADYLQFPLLTRILLVRWLHLTLSWFHGPPVPLVEVFLLLLQPCPLHIKNLIFQYKFFFHALRKIVIVSKTLLIIMVESWK